MAEGKGETPEEKLLKVIQSGEGAPVADASVSENSVAAPEEPFGRPRIGRGMDMVIIGRAFSLVALILVVLSVYETYRNRPAQAGQVRPVVFDQVAVRVPAEGVPVNEAMDMFARRRIFGPPPPQQEMAATENAPVVGWRAYVRDHYSLMGMSDLADGSLREAIVMDNKVKKMQFLREGQVLSIANQDVEVSHIGTETVEFKRGDELLTIE